MSINLYKSITFILICSYFMVKFMDKKMIIAAIVALVVGQQWVEGQPEETVQCGAAGIDGCNARRGQHHPFLLGVLGNIAQERGLTRARLPRQEKRTARVVHYLQGILPLLVLYVQFHVPYVQCSTFNVKSTRPRIRVVSSFSSVP